MKTLLVVGNDDAFRSQIAPWLGERGWTVIGAKDRRRGIDLATQHKPEIVLCDLVALDGNGIEFCRDFCGREESRNAARLVAVGAGGVVNKVQALEAGADEYVVKTAFPEVMDKYLDQTDALSRREGSTVPGNASASQDIDGVRLRFWGVRGSIPSPGPETVYYGGNTSCVEVRVGSDIIVLDAGSGLRPLGLALGEEFKEQPMQLNLLITHTHWDHIQGFPFFLPAYDPKNNVTIFGYEGATQGLKNTLSSQMESPYFPISLQQMPGHIAIRELHEPEFTVNKVVVRAKLLNHPGSCTGYRLMTPGGSISYLPDIELRGRPRDFSSAEKMIDKSAPAELRELAEFVRDSDVLIMDSQYDAVEYEKHIGWGHTCLEDCVAFAMQANVQRLFLFHHDPDHTDEHISRMVARARQMASRCHSKLTVDAAREGYELVLKPRATA
jgi:phosphoribosyl 1,2-cyclic phosphodiesterase/ActR/RegA family two-component response regulator